MMTTSTFNVRLDNELRTQATQVFESYGLSPTQAIKLFFNQVVATKTIPLNFEYKKDDYLPNLATQQSLLEVRQEYQTGNLQRYRTADEAMLAMEQIANG